jgi:predicted small secreted protein
MFRKNLWQMVVLLVIAALVLAACAPAAANPRL